jgi:hypothetical protein
MPSWNLRVRQTLVRESDRPAHWDKIDAAAARQGISSPSGRDVAVSSIEPLSGERRDKFGGREREQQHGSDNLQTRHVESRHSCLDQLAGFIQ